jgi:hypothetical protein
VASISRSRVLIGVLIALALGAIGTYAIATHRETETYTVSVAGVVTATDSARYTLAGHAGTVDVSFVASGAAGVGDLLLAGEGSPTWGYAARRFGGQWCIRATSRLEGASIDANLGDAGGRPGVDIHLRIPKADDFRAGLDGNRVLGNALCLDSAGRAVSAE